MNDTAWGGSAYPWHSSHVVSTLVVGFVALIVFVIYGELPLRPNEFTNEPSTLCSRSSEIYMPLEQALVPMSLFKITNYSAVVITASVGTMIYFSMNILWPLQIAALYTTDNIEIGWLSVSKPSSLVALFYFLRERLKKPKLHCFVITNALSLN
jgi:hypothetical protein